MAGNEAGRDIPSVELSISTSSSTLDILGGETFSIILTAVLRFSSPIVFDHTNTIFDINTAIRDSGLSFTNIKTGEAATRSPNGLTCILSLDSGKSISKHRAITLQPNEKYPVIHTLGPFGGKRPHLGNTDEQQTWRKRLNGPEGGMWYGTLGLGSETYEISVPADRCIPVWKRAPSMMNLWGWWGDELQSTPIRFEMKKTAIFSMKQVEDPCDMTVSFQM